MVQLAAHGAQYSISLYAMMRSTSEHAADIWEAVKMGATLNNWTDNTFSFLPSLLIIAIILIATRIIARRTQPLHPGATGNRRSAGAASALWDRGARGTAGARSAGLESGRAELPGWPRHRGDRDRLRAPGYCQAARRRCSAAD